MKNITGVIALIFVASLIYYKLPAVQKNTLVKVTEPSANKLVTSPLAVKGEARGPWYFEASFPAQIIDDNGVVLAEVPVQAKGEWMTEKYVPFEASISFTQPTTETGKLVLKKDNPSGLPEHDAQFMVPLRFDLTATSNYSRKVTIYGYDETLDLDSSGTVLCSEKGLVALPRTIPPEGEIVAETIKLFLTEFLPGVTLAEAKLEAGALTLTLEDPNNVTSGGSCKVGILLHQIQATAEQFPEVTSVSFLPEEILQP